MDSAVSTNAPPSRKPCKSSRSLLLVGALLLIAVPALASGGGGDDDGGHTVIGNIAVCMVAASLLGLLARAFRQPLLLGYLVAGIVIGPVGLGLIRDETQISTVAEIGLILLLFMIGLEIDLRKMLAAGRLVIVTGLLQVPLTLGLAFLAFATLHVTVLPVGEGAYAALYLAIAVSISSTMVVVKLLYDKMELDSVPGRITLGLLVFQDVWAIVVLAVQPDLADPRLGKLAVTFSAAALLIAAALLTSRYVLPRVFRAVAKLPELLLVISLGWCFLLSLVAAHPAVGLSMEMGALIAGITLATFPYNLDVIAKVISIRDFFITLFFVALGMQIPMPTTQTLLVAGLIAGVLLIGRLVGVWGVLHFLRAGHRSAIIPSINLSQMSEFSLVILAFGISYGHIGKDVLASAIWAFAFLAVTSTYLILYSHQLQTLSARVLEIIGLRDAHKAKEEELEAASRERPVVLLGFFRVASGLVDYLMRHNKGMLEQLLVVDFNPHVKARLEERGVAVVYGDISHLDTLHHAGVEHARVIVCSVPDFRLQGTSNERLLKLLTKLAPDAQIFVTAESPEHARALYGAGAAFVIQPAALAGASAVHAIEQALAGALEPVRSEAEGALEGARDLLATSPAK